MKPPTNAAPAVRDAAQPPTPPRTVPTLPQLFRVFFVVGATGFGGVIVWLRRALVEEHGWLTADEFNEALSVGQFLPGPNIFNIIVVLGRHFHGLRGIVVMTFAIMALPMLFAMALGALYLRFGQLPAVKDTMRGVAPVAAGLVLTLAVKTASSRHLRNELAIVAVLTFVAVAIFRFSLPVVMLTMGPVALLVAMRRVH